MGEEKEKCITIASHRRRAVVNANITRLTVNTRLMTRPCQISPPSLHTPSRSMRLTTTLSGRTGRTHTICRPPVPVSMHQICMPNDATVWRGKELILYPTPQARQQNRAFHRECVRACVRCCIHSLGGLFQLIICPRTHQLATQRSMRRVQLWRAFI